MYLYLLLFYLSHIITFPHFVSLVRKAALCFVYATHAHLICSLARSPNPREPATSKSKRSHSNLRRIIPTILTPMTSTTIDLLFCFNVTHDLLFVLYFILRLSDTLTYFYILFHCCNRLKRFHIIQIQNQFLHQIVFLVSLIS